MPNGSDRTVYVAHASFSTAVNFFFRQVLKSYLLILPIVAVTSHKLMSAEQERGEGRRSFEAVKQTRRTGRYCCRGRTSLLVYSLGFELWASGHELHGSVGWTACLAANFLAKKSGVAVVLRGMERVRVLYDTAGRDLWELWGANTKEGAQGGRP